MRLSELQVTTQSTPPSTLYTASQNYTAREETKDTPKNTQHGSSATVLQTRPRTLSMGRQNLGVRTCNDHYRQKSSIYHHQNLLAMPQTTLQSSDQRSVQTNVVSHGLSNTIATMFIVTLIYYVNKKSTIVNQHSNMQI